MHDMLTAAVVHPLPAFDWNPLNWLGGAAGAAAETGWTKAMTALWSVGLWILEFVLKLIDTFTTPDLDPQSGTLAAILPLTTAIGGSLATLIAFGQLVLALVRRSGESLGVLLAGIVKYAVLSSAQLGYRAAVVVGAGALTRAILEVGLSVSSFGGWTATASFPRQVTDSVLATALGLLTPLLIIPSAAANLAVGLARCAALLVMSASWPITASGLLGESTSSWFWKENRWFHAAALTPVLSALMLAMGVQMSKAVVSGAGDPAMAVGTVFVTTILLMMAAAAPVALFRLLAFVDPGTTSGANFRASLNANGGVRGLLSRNGSGASTAASTVTSSGESSGEAAAAAVGQSRAAAAMSRLGGRSSGGAGAAQGTATAGGASGLGGAVGGALTKVSPYVAVAAAAIGKANEVGVGMLDKAITHGSDALNMTGVGHQQHYYGDQRPLRHRSSASRGATGGGHSSTTGSTPGAGGGATAAPPPPPALPTPRVGPGRTPGSTPGSSGTGPDRKGPA